MSVFWNMKRKMNSKSSWQSCNTTFIQEKGINWQFLWFLKIICSQEKTGHELLPSLKNLLGYGISIPIHHRARKINIYDKHNDVEGNHDIDDDNVNDYNNIDVSNSNSLTSYPTGSSLNIGQGI